MNRSTFTTAFVVVVLLAVGALMERTEPHDDTDPPGERSGFRVMRDELTGCEYLKTMFAAPIPRLDESGRQVCRRGK